MFSMFKELIATCDRLLAPPNCHGCGTVLYERLNAFDGHVCRACAEGIPVLAANTCPLCGHPVRSAEDFQGGRCAACRQAAPGFDRLNACFAYNGIAQQLIQQFKYQGRAYLAQTMARLMFTVINKDSVSVFDALVPVPLFPTRLREREFNQAQVLAECLAAETGVPVLPVLARTKNTRSQATLRESDRPANVQGAFRVIPDQDLDGQRLLLIDDILTTGATASEAANALKEAGAGHVAVLAFAKG